VHVHHILYFGECQAFQFKKAELTCYNNILFPDEIAELVLINITGGWRPPWYSLYKLSLRGTSGMYLLHDPGCPKSWV